MYSTNPVVERALRFASERKARGDLRTRTSAVALNAKLSIAIDDYAQKTFEAIVDPRNEAKRKSALDARREIDRIKNAIRQMESGK